jgi:hypothetical protein
MKFALGLAVGLWLTPWVWAQVQGPFGTEEAQREFDLAIDRDPKGVASRLPDTWGIPSPEGEIRVPTDALAEHLKNSDTTAAHRWVAELRQHADSASSAAPRDAKADRKALDAILARKEFRPNKPPNAWQRFVQAVQDALGDWFRSLTEFATAHPAASKLLFWSLVTLAIAALLLFLYKMWTHGDAIPALPLASTVQPELQDWRKWARDAKAAAERSDYRQAVRCAYWAGVARLIEDRPTHISFTDTPRERLQVLARPLRNRAALPAEQMEPLRRMTTKLERHWYAKQEADRQDAQHAFEDLEALGCKLD